MLTGQNLRERRVAREKKNSIAVGQRIKAARMNSDIRQEILAERLGISRSCLSQWENGEPATPISFEVIQDIAAFTKANAFHLMFGEMADGNNPAPNKEQKITLQVTGTIVLVTESEMA
jgi:transcriptional regulator with XRE-family HTH domain